MLDIHFIREHRDEVLHAIRVKGVDLDLDQLLALDTQHRSLLQEVEVWRAERNEISKTIAEASGDEKQKLIEKMRSRKEEMAAKEDEMQKLQDQLHNLLLRTPNIPWSGSPVGPDASANTEIRREGTPPEFSFTPKDHVELGT
ncbi:MAG: serine--tRNA ligase, partial [bacterium]|nr:serine--tRNA ligase [bacterium]